MAALGLAEGRRPSQPSTWARGKGLSVLEVIAAAERALGTQAAFEMRAGGPAIRPAWSPTQPPPGRLRLAPHPLGRRHPGPDGRGIRSRAGEKRIGPPLSPTKAARDSRGSMSAAIASSLAREPSRADRPRRSHRLGRARDTLERISTRGS